MPEVSLMTSKSFTGNKTHSRTSGKPDTVETRNSVHLNISLLMGV